MYRGSLIVKITDSWLACHEFKPITAEDPQCRETMLCRELKRPPVGVVWKSGEGQCRPLHLTMVQNYEVRRQKPSSSWIGQF
ncbi:hypothetical protein TNCV_3220861 [Trichonephila clavipes]|nr:hypothetical protein TNCV_3220861 [Trichonephila clavipes]